MNAPLTMRVHPYVAHEIDHDGAMRRAGTWNPDAVPVPVARDRWIHKNTLEAFRVWDGKLWRKTYGQEYYGGYRIQYVSLANARLVREWLS